MGFDINNFLNAEREVKSDWKPVKLSVHKLRPAAGKENFYHMDDKEIEETARTIELVGIRRNIDWCRQSGKAAKRIMAFWL